MVMQNQRLELLYDEAECYYYAITNCASAQDGCSSFPGFRVTMHNLNRESWQRLKPFLTLDYITGEEAPIPDDVAMEIFYCLLGGMESAEYRDKLGWEITSICLYSETAFCMNVANRQLEALNDLLSHVDDQSVSPEHPVSTLTCQVPISSFWVYWAFDETADFTVWLDAESLDEEDEKYQIRLGSQLHIVEKLPHRRRELNFHSSAIERDGQKYLPVDVVETLY